MRRTHDLLSLVAGLLFTGLGIALLVRGSLHLGVRWLWPVLLVALALALLPGVGGSRDGGGPAAAGPPPVASGTGGGPEAL